MMRLTQWAQYPLVPHSTRQGRSMSTSPGYQAQPGCFQIPCLSLFAGCAPCITWWQLQAQPGEQGHCHHDSKQTSQPWTRSLGQWVSWWDRLWCSRDTQLSGGSSASSSIPRYEWTCHTRLHTKNRERGLSLRLQFGPELQTGCES